MLRRLDLRGAGTDLRGKLPRPDQAADGPVAAVQEILADVRERGDDAVRDLTERFDGTRPGALRVPPADIGAALEAIDPALRAALETAAAGIRHFHEQQVVGDHAYERDGISVVGRKVPVDRADFVAAAAR